MMLAPRFEATPVPVRGCGIRPSELRSLVYEERRVGIPRPRPLVIDLTKDDDDDEHEPQVQNRNDPLFTLQFAALAIRPTVASNANPISRQLSANPQVSACQRIPRLPHTIPRLGQASSPRSNKRKESESGEEGDEAATLSAKRRLRPRKPVTYSENGPGDDIMDLDEPLENLIPSVEKDDDDNESDGDAFADFEVERVIAHRTRRGMHDYLLGWVGYTELTWIPEEHCDCDQLIAQFRNVPRFDVPGGSSQARELIEEERVRWLQRAVGQRADTPARPVRERGPGSARNPKTGRFERRKVRSPRPIPPILPRSDRVIPDSEDEEGENDVMSIGPDVQQHAEQMATAWTILDSCSVSRTLSPSQQSKIRSAPPPDTSQNNRTQDIISIRQTPVEDALPAQKPAPVDPNNQQPRQTAKVFWTRNTPGADEERTSFVQMGNGKAFTTLSVGSESIHAVEASRWRAVKLDAAKFLSTRPKIAPGCTEVETKTTVSSSSRPAGGAESQAVMAGLDLDLQQPAHAQQQTSLTEKPSSFTTPKQRVSPSSSTSPARNAVFKPFSSWSAVNDAPKASSESSPTILTQSSSSARDAPNFATSKPKSIHYSLASMTPRANTEPTWRPKTASKVAQTSVSSSSPERRPFSSTSQKQVPNTATAKQNAASLSWTNPVRQAVAISATEDIVAKVSQSAMTGMARATESPFTISTPPANSKSPRPLSNVGVSKSVAFSWSPPSSPEKGTRNTRTSPDAISNAGDPPGWGMARSTQPASNSTLLRDARTKSPRPASAADVPRSLEPGISRTQHSHSTPPAKDAGTTSTILVAHVVLPATSETERRVLHDAERESVGGTWGAKNSLQQQKLANLWSSPQDLVAKSHGFKVNVVKRSNADVQTSANARAKGSMSENRGCVHRKESSRSPIRRKLAKERRQRHLVTSAIEAEIASNAGAHGIFKKNVATILSNASMKAPRQPDVTQRVPSAKTDRERSPSVATTAFLKAREREKAQKQAPSAVRREVNGDYGHYYPIGLCMVAKELEALNIRCRYRAAAACGFSISDDTPRPSIEK
jgi:hypothetical protein